MKKFQEQFRLQSEKVTLTAAERRDLRERVISYMEYHPLPQTVRSTPAAPVSVPAGPAWTWGMTLPLMRWRTMIGSTVAIVMLAVPMLAERALPGDILYAVKVGFNEEVRSTITRSPFERVEWETERLNRRLAEVQVLAREGRLTEAHEERVAVAVRGHSEAARASIERLREEDADEAAMAEIALDALFDVHAAVLTAHGQSDAELAVTILEVEEDDITATAPVERRSRILEALESSRADASVGRDPERPSYEGLLRRIEVESAQAYALLTTVADIASDDALSSVARRLDDVERKVQQAVTLHEAGELLEARIALTEALTSTRKVITFMSNIEIRNSVDLDTIVPIEHTAEELREQLHFKQERLQVRFAYVQEAVSEIATSSVQASAEEALVPLPDMFASSTVAIAAEEFATAGTLLAEIEEVLDIVVRTADIPDRLPSVDLGTTTAAVATSTPTTTPAVATSTPTTTDTTTATDLDTDVATSSATSTLGDVPTTTLATGTETTAELSE